MTARKTAGPRSGTRYALKLFIAGATDRSHQAVLRVRELCANELQNGCTLEVIDIYQQPALARENQIIATPTLIKERPKPVRRFIGNLMNTSGLFTELELVHKIAAAA
jgi:circadian clock protein KaiB